MINMLLSNFSEFNWWVWYLIFSLATTVAAMVDWYLSNNQLKNDKK